MEVRDVTSGPKVELETSTRKQAKTEVAEASEKGVSGKSSQVTDSVELSAKGGIIAEKSGVVEKEEGKQAPANGNEKAIQPEEEEAGQTVSLRRDYSVEDGKLVVKFVDTSENRVVKEIPPEEERRIREAISKFRENDTKHEAPEAKETEGGDSTPKVIDVTS